MKRAIGAACVGLLLLAAAASAAPTPGAYQQGDFKGFWNILPPGSNGVDSAVDAAQFELTGKRPPNWDDQLAMYRDLIYASPGLKADDIPKYFKDASFGTKPEDVVSTETPRDDVVIQRDKFGVPHIWADTRTGAMFGSGYAQAEDRLFLMDVYRHIGKGQGASFIGGSGRDFDHQVWQLAPYKPGELDQQFANLPKLFGQDGVTVQNDIRAYVDGVNAYIDAAKLDPNKMPVEYAAVNHPEGPAPWTISDVMTNGIVIGAILGAGGGGELDNALTLETLEKRFGARKAKNVFADFREQMDPEAPTTSNTRTPWEAVPKHVAKGSMAMPDSGSTKMLPVIASSSGGGSSSGSANGLSVPLSGLHGISNALLVNRKYTTSGRPIAVFGPQTGYFEPQALTEIDLHGGPDLQARGMAIPGTPYVDIGRGPDYAWSATSSNQDLIDTFAVPLCDPDGKPVDRNNPTGYVYNGTCNRIDVLEETDSWQPNLVDSTPAGSETLRAYRTKVGLGIATATIKGKPVMYTSQRSTYNHEFDAAAAIVAWNAPNRNNTPQQFMKNAMMMGYAFNWFYVDDKHIAYINPGYEPVRGKNLNPNFPVWAKPKFEWKNWNPDTWTSTRASEKQRPKALDQNWIISWNNKQAPGYAAPDAEWGYSSLYRSLMLQNELKARLKKGKVALPQVIDAMSAAATTDFRGVYVLPWALKVLGKQKDPKLADAIAKLKVWRASGAHRIDRDKDGVYDNSEAIRIMDAWWPLWVEGEFKPVLGDAAWKSVSSRFENGIDNTPNGGGAHHGSAYQGGAYGQVQKDLRDLLKVRGVKGRYSRVYCGGGKLKKCRAMLASTLAQAIDTPNDKVYGADKVCDKQPTIGPPDPMRKSHDQMCYDAIWQQAASAIESPIIPWQNRPTFQQAVEVQGHR